MASKTKPPEAKSASNRTFDAPSDPIAMYLREIGEVQLLSPPEEKEVALRIDLGGRVRAVEKELGTLDSSEGMAWEIAARLLEDLEDFRDAALAATKRRGIPFDGSLSDTLLNPRVRTVLESSLPESAAAALGEEIDVEEPDDARNAVKTFALASRLVHRKALDAFRDDQNCADIRAALACRETSTALRSMEFVFRRQFLRVKSRSATAKNQLTRANLRLVVSVAKKYIGRGITLLDLIQEGNIGLMKAVDKYDYRRGYKFSTYSSWWIRQAITRALADHSRTIRIPVNLHELVNKIVRLSREFTQNYGREPTNKELAQKLEISEERVKELLKIAQEPLSLTAAVGGNGDSEESYVGDFIEDVSVESPVDAAIQQLLKEHVSKALQALNSREAQIIGMRHGLEDGKMRTLEEVGRVFGVTRERIRQIEAGAIKKLMRSPEGQALKLFLD